MSVGRLPIEDLAQMSADNTLASRPDLTDTAAQVPPQPAAEPPRKLARIKNYKLHRNPARNARKAKTGKPFVQLFYCWWSSPVIRSLSSVERDALVSILTRYNGHNNGKLPVSVRWLSLELGIGKSTAQRALDRLRAAALIERVVAGRFQGRLSRATRWRVTCYGCDVSAKQPTDWTRLPALSPVSRCDTPVADNL
jgi:DNA-binding transcriptional ArsR family regulator